MYVTSLATCIITAHAFADKCMRLFPLPWIATCSGPGSDICHLRLQPGGPGLLPLLPLHCTSHCHHSGLPLCVCQRSRRHVAAAAAASHRAEQVMAMGHQHHPSLLTQQVGHRIHLKVDRGRCFVTLAWWHACPYAGGWYQSQHCYCTGDMQKHACTL